MKKIVLVAVFLLLALNFGAEAQDEEFIAPPDSVLFGAYEDGTFFITKKIIDAVEGEHPKVMFSRGNWKKEEMKLSANKEFYFFKSGNKFTPLFKIDYCFSIGGNRFIPHTLSSIEDEEILNLIKEGDIIDNEVGGYNFRTEPIPVPK